MFFRIAIVAGTFAAGFRVSRDFQVIELTGAGVQVQSELTVASLEFAGAAARGVGAAVTQLTGTVDAVDGLGRDAIVEGVDHPADGAAAIEQGCRAANDFNALDVDRVQWYCVIVRQRRSIQRADTITQNADAVAVLTANDRPARARTKVRRRDAGLLVQGFAKAALRLQREVVAAEHGRRRSQCLAAKWIAGDDLGLQFKWLAGEYRRGEQQRDGQRIEASLQGVGTGRHFRISVS